MNLYGFVGNDGLSQFDLLGKISTKVPEFPLPTVSYNGLPPAAGGIRLGNHQVEHTLIIRTQKNKKCCLEAELKISQPSKIIIDSAAIARVARVSVMDVLIHEQMHHFASIKRSLEIVDDLELEQECYESEAEADAAGLLLLQIYEIKMKLTQQAESMHDQSGGYGTPRDSRLD